MTLKEINRAIQAKAPNVTLYKGEGYLYYIFDDQARNVHESHSEYVPYLYMRNSKTWIADGIAFAEKVEGEIAERGSFGESINVLSPFAPHGCPAMMAFGDTMLDWMKEEPLHPDLEPYLRTGTVLGDMVHSPLLVSALSMGRNRCAHVNGIYEQKKQMLAEALAERNFARAIMVHERPYRFDALVDMVDKGLEQGSPDFWSALGQVWIDSENIHENFASWREMWQSNPEHRHHAMTPEDRAGFSRLRNNFPIYRGFSWRGTKLGMSWTTSRKKAIWFAQRFDETGNGHVISVKVQKGDVLAYFDRRREQEVVIDPAIAAKWEYVEI